MNFKQEALNGIKWTTIGTILTAVLQLVQLMVLARYLTSTDFGIVAILMVIITFSQVFVDFGLSNSIIFKKDITMNQLSTLYWLNIIVSILIYIIILSAIPYISIFYNEPKLKEYVWLMGSILVIQSFGQQFRTIFQKELQFAILSKIDIFATLISVCLAIVLAIYSFGVYSLIYSTIIMVSIKTICLIYFGLNYHRLSLYFKFTEIKEFISFGFYVVGNGIVSTIATQIDTILIGKLLGTESLGLYNVAKELVLRPSQIINPIVTKVAFPIMSKVNHDLSEVRRFYLKLLNYVSSINFPIYMFAIILAPEIITIFLGEKWLEITYLFQILAAWALLRSRGNPIGSLVMAVGKPQYEMYWNIGMVIYMPIMIYISSFWGILGLAFGNLISMILLFIPEWYFLAYKLCKINLYDYFYNIFIIMIISFFICLIVFFLMYYFNINSLLYKLFLIFFIALPLIIILYKKFNTEFYLLIIKLIKFRK